MFHGAVGLTHYCARFFLALFLAAIVPVLAQGQPIEDSMGEFNRIRRIRDLRAQDVKTFQAQFHRETGTYSDGNRQVTRSKDIRFGTKGAKSYYSSSIQQGSETGKSQITFDGDAVRSYISTQDKMITVSRSEEAKRKRFGAPSPHDTVFMGHTMNRLFDQIQKGDIKLLAAERVIVNESDTVKFTFQLPAGFKLEARLELWLDTERGFWPIKGTIVNDDTGQIVTRMSNVELGKFDVEGNIYYYPIEIMIEGHRPGRELGQFTSYRIEEESVRINEDIPDSYFVLQARPDQVIYDVDLALVIQDPAKGFNLEKDIKTVTKDAEAQSTETTPPPPEMSDRSRQLSQKAIADGLKGGEAEVTVRESSMSMLYIALCVAALMLTGVLLWRSGKRRKGTEI